MNLTDEDFNKIDSLIEKRLTPINARLERLELQGKTTHRRLDVVEDRLDTITEAIDDVSEQSSQMSDDLTYVKQKQRQDHHEVMVKLDELRAQETEDINAAYTDIARLKKRVKGIAVKKSA